MTDEEFEMYIDDPSTRPTQLHEVGGAYDAIQNYSKDLLKLVKKLQSIPEILATEAPTAYARNVLDTVGEIRLTAEWLGRVVADSQLVHHKGRGRTTSGAMTQAEIAEALGVARTTVARWSTRGPLRTLEGGQIGPHTLKEASK